MSKIDVSKCVHYHDGSCWNDNTMFECCSKNDCIYKQRQQLKATLDEIEEIVKDVCDEECGFKWRKGKKHCGDDDCRYMQIMVKIKQAKEDKNV